MFKNNSQKDMVIKMKKRLTTLKIIIVIMAIVLTACDREPHENMTEIQLKNEEWRSAAVEFLSQFPVVIFEGGNIPVTVMEDSEFSETGRYTEGSFEENPIQAGEFLGFNTCGEITISTQIPEIYYVENHGFFDSDGNQITDAVWIHNVVEDWEIGYSVRQITFYDLDNDGVPEIEVFYYPHWVHSVGGGWGYFRLFKYESEEYREVLDWNAENGYHYYRNDEDELVTYRRLGYRGQCGAQYSFAAFNGTSAVIDAIATLNTREFDKGWENHITGETNIPDSLNYHPASGEVNRPSYVPGMQMTLTLIEPFEWNDLAQKVLQG